MVSAWFGMVSTATKREFLRWVYAESAATESARNITIDTWREAAIDALKGGGVLTATAANGHSAGFQIIPGWSVDHVLYLADWARGYISLSTAALAVASVPSAVRMFSTHTTNLHVMG
jgi:hypothetical protein